MSDLVRLRASSLPELFDCPARWEAKHVKNMRLPTSAAAQLGTAVHAGTAVFDMARIVGEDVSAEDSAENVVKAIWHPETDVDWSDTPQKEAEPIALALHRKYCDEISPKFTFADVEAECESLDIPELGISLTGTTDRIFSTALGEYGIADLKTGKSAVSTDGTVKTAGHAAQIAVYELLAEVATQKEITAPAGADAHTGAHSCVHSCSSNCVGSRSPAAISRACTRTFDTSSTCGSEATSPTFKERSPASTGDT